MYICSAFRYMNIFFRAIWQQGAKQQIIYRTVNVINPDPESQAGP